MADAAGAPSLPPECVRLIVQAGSSGKLLDSVGRRRKADLLQVALIDWIWLDVALEELWRHLYIEQWKPRLMEGIEEAYARMARPARVETITLGSVSPVSSLVGWTGSQVRSVLQLCATTAKEVTLVTCDDFSIDGMSSITHLNILHLLMAGHFKHLHAKVADITSSFPHLTRLSLIDVPILDVAAVFAAGACFPALRDLVLVRPQFAHPTHPFERARNGTTFGPHLTGLVLGQNYQHALSARSLGEFVQLTSFAIVGSEGSQAGGMRPLEFIKAPLRQVSLAHAFVDDSLLATLRRRPISVSQLAELNLLRLEENASESDRAVRGQILSWARENGCVVREREEPTAAVGNDLAELELELLTQPIDESHFIGRPLADSG